MGINGGTGIVSSGSVLGGSGISLPKGGVTPFVGLLDLYPSAAAAYSVRRLSSTYEDALIRVREDGGDTEADIGFDANGNLDTAALLSHCGANNGYVVTWYDQSGNSNNATQSTAGNQPKIYDSVSGVVEENGKPCLTLNGSSMKLDLPAGLLTFTNQDNNSCYAITKSNNNSTRERVVFFGDGTSTKMNLGYDIGLNGVTYVNSTGFSNGVFGTTIKRGFQFMLFGDKSGTTQELFSNTTSIGSNSKGNDVAVANGSLFAGDTIQFFNGTCQEVVLFNESYKSQISGIFNNVNEYYTLR
jgi:hypothetical protein